MKLSQSTKRVSAVFIAVLSLGVLGGTLLSQDAESVKRHSARHHAPVFKEAGAGKEFDSFLGGQFRYKDAQGKTITVDGIPGKVTKLEAGSVSLKLNDGGSSKDFALKADPEDSRDVEAQFRHLEIGGKAVVVVVNGEAKYLVDMGREAPEHTKTEKKEKAKK
jgi:hypothetical protein